MFACLTAHAKRSLVALGLCMAIASPSPSRAALLWSWSYDAPGITAGGTLTTDDVADSQGFYQIFGITGSRNGIAITGLQPTDTAIPGNEGFPVDNLISASGPQLTGEGFGYSTADGNFANTFFADFLDPASYAEFFSAPPFGPGTGPEDTELPVSFTAAIPEPGTASILIVGITGLIAGRFRQRRIRASSGS